jgi:hypothetical protein
MRKESRHACSQHTTPAQERSRLIHYMTGHPNYMTGHPISCSGKSVLRTASSVSPYGSPSSNAPAISRAWGQPA